jgi:hypothetical protein
MCIKKWFCREKTIPAKTENVPNILNSENVKTPNDYLNILYDNEAFANKTITVDLDTKFGFMHEISLSLEREGLIEYNTQMANNYFTDNRAKITVKGIAHVQEVRAKIADRAWTREHDKKTQRISIIALGISTFAALAALANFILYLWFYTKK